VRSVFLVCLLGVTVINYLPTRLGLGAVLLSVGCALALRQVCAGEASSETTGWCIGLSPWAAAVGAAYTRTGHDRWHRFRDRFGIIWSLRLREQFNRAAANAAIGVELRWSGLRGDVGPAADDLLMQLTKRFLG
jgi:hypothetical protein